MPRIDSSFKEQVKTLSKDQLETIVIRMAGKDKAFHDYLLANYLDTTSGEAVLFAAAQDDIRHLYIKGYKGFSPELRLAGMIEACNKRIKDFDAVCKSKNLKADLMVMVLDEVFSYPLDMFGTCFTKLDYKAGLMVKSLLTLVTTKLHPDYQIEYRDKINGYLKVLKDKSCHLDFIYLMPESI